MMEIMQVLQHVMFVILSLEKGNIDIDNFNKKHLSSIL